MTTLRPTPLELFGRLPRPTPPPTPGADPGPGRERICDDVGTGHCPDFGPGLDLTDEQHRCLLDPQHDERHECLCGKDWPRG